MVVRARDSQATAFLVAQEEPRSFLSLDTEGRVIRLDSFSKVISSGIRVGFMTAAAPLIASVELHLQSSHLHAPTLSQVGRERTLTLCGETHPLRVVSCRRYIRTSKFLRRGTVSQIDRIVDNYFHMSFNSTIRNVRSRSTCRRNSRKRILSNNNNLSRAASNATRRRLFSRKQNEPGRLLLPQ